MGRLAWIGGTPPADALTLLEQCGWTVKASPSAPAATPGDGADYAAVVVVPGAAGAVPATGGAGKVVLFSPSGEVPAAMQHLDFLATSIEQVLQVNSTVAAKMPAGSSGGCCRRDFCCSRALLL